MSLRALVFDVFGTLVDWRSAIAEAFAASGVPGDPEELADAWRARYRPILDEVNEGARPWGDFDELHHATLDDLLTVELRVPSGSAWCTPGTGSTHGRTFGRAWTSCAEHVTATLSNGHLALLVDLARHGDLRFDCLLSAELARVTSPRPRPT